MAPWNSNGFRDCCDSKGLLTYSVGNKNSSLLEKEDGISPEKLQQKNPTLSVWAVNQRWRWENDPGDGRLTTGDAEGWEQEKGHPTVGS